MAPPQAKPLWPSTVSCHTSCSQTQPTKRQDKLIHPRPVLKYTSHVFSHFLSFTAGFYVCSLPVYIVPNIFINAIKRCRRMGELMVNEAIFWLLVHSESACCKCSVRQCMELFPDDLCPALSSVTRHLVGSFTEGTTEL